MIDFRSQPPPDSRQENGHKAPPNYFSRKVQLRLILMVFMFMFILYLIDQARDPDSWRWIWSAVNSTPQEPPAGSKSTPVVDDLPPPPSMLTTTEQPLLDPLNWLKSKGTGNQGYQHFERELWRKLTASLTSEERQVLDTMLKSSRDGSPLKPQTRSDWSPLIEKIDAGWNRYHNSENLLMSTNLTDSQKSYRLDVLTRLKRFCEGPLTAGFDALRDEQELSKDQQQALLQVQSVLDHLALEKIRDGVFRGSDHTSWFRLFEKLTRATPRQIKQASSANVNFLQLDSQGQEYRGKLVTVSGIIRQGYRVRAPKNILGIREYFVFTLKPSTGPEKPISIYCLKTPEGFPALPDKDLDRKTASLREKASFTGYYFKSRVYKTKTSTFASPLILAREPDWIPTPAKAPSPQTELTLWKIALICVGTMVAAILFTLFVYWRSRWKNRAVTTLVWDQQARGSLNEILADPVGPDTFEAPRPLEQENSTSSKTADPDSASGETPDA